MLIEIVVVIISNILTFPILFLADYSLDRIVERYRKKREQGKTDKTNIKK